MQDLRLAAVTLNPKYLNVQANLEAICAWSERVRREGADVVIFPEGYLTGYDLETMEETALTLDAPEVRTIQQLADASRMVISFGMLERATEGFFVTQVYVGSGALQYHRKCHRTAWEKQYCQAGNRLEVQDIGPAKLGTLICYDSAFPQAAETLVRKGAEILVQPSCHGMWAKDAAPEKRAELIQKRRTHVLKYWRARAYDYSSYAVYVNHCGVTTRGEWFPNYAAIYAPDGETLTECVSEGEQMVIASLSRKHLEECRAKDIGHFSTLKDARPELYCTAK